MKQDKAHAPKPFVTFYLVLIDEKLKLNSIDVDMRSIKIYQPQKLVVIEPLPPPLPPA